MIENKGIGSKIFDVINVVILVLITLICILPVWYVLCVSLSSREAVNAGQVALWPVGFNLLSYQKILGESDFFGSFLVSVKRVVLGTGVSMVCILLAAYPLSRTKKQFPKRDIFMWIFVFCMLFNGLYGGFAMQISDWIARNAPILGTINPAQQVTNLFYDILYYDSYQPFITTCAILLAMSAVFLLAGIAMLRRQRYEHL